MELAKRLGLRLRELRAERKLTLEQLGVASGMPPESLSRFERGRTVPSLASLEHVAQGLGMSVAEVLASEPGPTRRPELAALMVRLQDRSPKVVGRILRVVDVLLELEEEDRKPGA